MALLCHYCCLAHCPPPLTPSPATAEVRKARFPLSVLLDKLSGTTRGEHRRLDLGHGRVYAEPINMAPLLGAKAALERNLEQLIAFEKVCVCGVCGGEGVCMGGGGGSVAVLWFSVWISLTRLS